MLVSILTTQLQENEEQYNLVPVGAHAAGPREGHSKAPQGYSNYFIPASGKILSSANWHLGKDPKRDLKL